MLRIGGANGARVVLDDPAVTPDLVAALAGVGARITKVVPHEPSLEELYFAVRRSARDLGEGTHADNGITPEEAYR